MNTLLWTAQIILAVIFLMTAASKLLAFDWLMLNVKNRHNGQLPGVSRPMAACIALAEIAGALGVVSPPSLEPHHLLIRLAAGGLALLMVAAGIYHLRRNEEAAPAVALFLLAVFVIVGRWPR